MNLEKNKEYSDELFKSIICNWLDGLEEKKEKYIPNKLYKYISLFDNKDIYGNMEDNTINTNNKKFITLNNNNIWLSKYTNLNDPFEGNNMYINNPELEQNGWNTEELRKVNLKMQQQFFIASFCEKLDLIPMWAHYANNHKGFCIEYDIINKKCIIPIRYDSKRYEISHFITEFLNNIHKLDKLNKKVEDDENYRKQFAFFFAVTFTKHLSWSYEEEYRVIDIRENDNNKSGESVNISDLGLCVNKIYSGINCDKENKEMLKKTCVKLNCEMEEMYVNYDTDNYKLSSKSILLY